MASEGVDVNSAVHEFKALERELEQEEKRGGNIEQGNEFNIREFFEESARQEASKGHKEKRMGVVVKDLTVVGLGADAMAIGDNLSPIKALWPLNW
jgi:ATP-binding cassette, subfamily G (WHITE), member 2, SNQ2